MHPIEGDRTALLQTLLPDDPEPGQEVVLPEGQTVGGANVINLSKAGKLLGSLSLLSPIANVSGKYDANRLTSKLKLKVGDVIHIQGWQHNYNAIQFVESFGWVGSGTTNTPTPLIDKHMRILALFPIGATTPGFYLYEKVCLEIIKGAENAKSTDTSRTQSGNRAQDGSGAPPSSGSGSSPRGSEATPRRRPVRRNGPKNRRGTGSSSASRDEQPSSK